MCDDTKKDTENSQESDKRKSHFLNLMMLAKADGKWHINEKKFLDAVAKRIGLTDEEHAEIVFSPEKIKYTIAESEKDRVMILYDMLFMMRIDGEVSKEEEGLCMEIGLRLGFNPLMVQEMINLMKRYTFQKVPDNSLLNILKKYIN